LGKPPPKILQDCGIKRLENPLLRLENIIPKQLTPREVAMLDFRI
jgi:hypothetical protein